MDLKKRCKIGVLSIFAILFVAMPVSAGTIFGVSPGNVDLQDVLRGGFAERDLKITLGSEEPVLVEMNAWGDVPEWLNFTQNFTVSGDNPGIIPIQVLPPPDIPNDNYTAFLRVSTGAVSDDINEGHATGVISAVVDVAFRIGITDVEITGCRAFGYNVKSVEQGDDLVFTVSITNQGNIRYRPNFNIEIWDVDQISVVKSVELRGDEILPTRTNEVVFRVPTSDLELGQYWVDVSVPECFSEDLLTFDILEAGALKAEGVLTGIKSEVWAFVDDTIPITANFENIGEKAVDATFDGQITRDGRIVQLLNSETINVNVGDSNDFTFFFTPKNVGQYVISGVVFYDKKRTYPSSTVVNINKRGFELGRLLMWIAYFIIITFIAFLFLRIRKERRRYMKKFR